MATSEEIDDARKLSNPELFHRLWGNSKMGEYEKALWNELQTRLQNAGFFQNAGFLK